ncbi:MAG: epoxyqueuosine reductase QueH [Methanosarcinales archaeon]|nr:epoxyqueuosine reductase QueH [ANME-2 cluster archaeon]MDW7776753.1 epoxyqueuosine reductase QueH [Methanosarcinales archaeon]
MNINVGELNMEMLLHICCAPCATYTVRALRDEGFEPVGYFYNPNIHPFTEYRRRLETLQQYAEVVKLDVVYRDEYMLEEFIKQAFEVEDRCQLCYTLRLEAAARQASDMGIPVYTSTLLISPYQKHEMIKDIGEGLASDYGVDFHYRDYRPGYKETYQLCRELELYRQPYCGCIFSEKDRYYRKLVEK